MSRSPISSNEIFDRMVDLKEVGKLLVHADSRQQAKLFNAFADEWTRMLLAPAIQMDMQLTYMLDTLNKNSLTLLKQFGEWCAVELKEKHEV